MPCVLVVASVGVSAVGVASAFRSAAVVGAISRGTTGVAQAAAERAAAGIEAMANRVVALADEVQRESDARHTAQRAAALLDLAAREVVEVNATIRLLRQVAPASVSLPEEIVVQGRSASQLDALLSQTRTLVQRARLEVERATLDAARARLAERVRMLPAGPTGPSAAEIIARHEANLLRRLSDDRGAGTLTRPTDGDRVARLHAQVDVLLADLDPDVLPAERDHVLFEATRADSTTSLEHLPDYVDHLADYVPAANARAERRRLAARWLQALEHEVVAAEDPVPPRISAARRELAGVVAGTRDLDEPLAAQARRALDDVVNLGRARQVRDVLEGCLLQHLGYAVLAQPRVEATRVRVTKPEWNGEHSVEFVVDADGYRATLTRDKAGVSEVVHRERRADFADDLAELPRLLGEHGVAVTRTELTPVQERHDGKPEHRPTATRSGQPLRRERKR